MSQKIEPVVSNVTTRLRVDGTFNGDFRADLQLIVNVKFF